MAAPTKILVNCVLIAIHLCNLTRAVELPKSHVEYIQAMITQFISSEGTYTYNIKVHAVEFVPCIYLFIRSVRQLCRLTTQLP